MGVPMSARLERLADQLLRPAGPGDVVAGAGESSAEAIARGLAALGAVLGRWFGAYGYHAVLTRALGECRQSHPVLGTLRLGDPIAPALHGLAEAQATHGPAALQAGARVLVARVLDLLGRVIGHDLLLHVLAPLIEEPGAPPHDSGDASSGSA